MSSVPLNIVPEVAAAIIHGDAHEAVAAFKGKKLVAINGIRVDRGHGDDLHVTLTFQGRPVAGLPTIAMQTGMDLTISSFLGLLEVRVD